MTKVREGTAGGWAAAHVTLCQMQILMLLYCVAPTRRWGNWRNYRSRELRVRISGQPHHPKASEVCSQFVMADEDNGKDNIEDVSKNENEKDPEGEHSISMVSKATGIDKGRRTSKPSRKQPVFTILVCRIYPWLEMPRCTQIAACLAGTHALWYPHSARPLSRARMARSTSPLSGLSCGGQR